MIPARRVLLGIAAALLLAGCSSSAPRSEVPVRRLVYLTHVGATNAETIVIARVDGAGAHRLTSGYYPQISPDGRWVAFFRCPDCKPDANLTRVDLYVISSTGGKPRLLLRDAQKAEWAPDSKTILTEHAARLTAVGLDGNRRTLAVGRYFRAGFSSDGRTVVFDRSLPGGGVCTSWSDIYAVRLSGGPLHRLTRDRLSAFPIVGSHAIAFAHSTPGRCGVHTVWTARADGSGAHAVVPRLPRTLTRAGDYGLSPVAWLPGGRRILGSIDFEFGNEAAVVDLRTGALRRLGVPVDAVSRDGRWIVGTSGGAEFPYSIVIAPVAGGRPRTIAHGRVCCPDWNR